MRCAIVRILSCTVTALLVIALPAHALWAQQRRAVRQAPQAVPVTDAQKAILLGALQDRIRETYTFPDNAASIAHYLDRQHASGAYNDITDGQAFAAELTSDLRAFTHDVHFAVQYDPDRYAQIASMDMGPNPSLNRFEGAEPMTLPPVGTPEYNRFVEPLRRRNFNLTQLEILDGNIGYLRITMMPPLEVARATVDAAMAFLAHTDALVIDLRDVPGGVGGFIPYLMSYFFPEGDLLLFTREFAFADTTLSFHTYAELPSPRLADVPLYILTSGTTGSAAENMAYTLQQHGRATVVGEPTVGGAHSSSAMLLADGFVAQIPIARVVHPVSRTNWQGTGVQPDLNAPAQDALLAAQIDALERLLEAPDDPRYRPQLVRYLDDVRAEFKTAAAARKAQENAFVEYEGTYGSRRVFVQNGTLRYQREGGPAVRLARLEGDLFRFDLDPNMRSPTPLPHIRFDRDASGSIVKMTAIREDGTIQDEFEKAR